MSATGATGTSPTGASTSTTTPNATSTTTKDDGLKFDSFEEFWNSLTSSTPTDEDGSLTGAGIVIVSMVFLGVVSVFILFTTGSIISLFVFWLLTAVVLTVLIYYKFIDIRKILGEDLAKNKAAATVANAAVGRASEVFHIADNSFTYDDAPAVCAAYGATMATLEQVIDSYNKGAEWCGYGWSAGGMALYPTQKATWDELQREIDPAKRTRCGRPGVNGGYFDPMNLFGVNCYGFKPPGNVTFPVPAPGVDKTAFNSAVNEYKTQLKSFTVNPWSRQQWNYGAQFTQPLGKLVESFIEYNDPFAEAAQGSSASTASAVGAPYGLKGDMGPTGPAGPASTVAGPAGPQGSQGPQGPKGDQGADSTIAGPMGPTGPRGVDGSVGPTGAKGEPGAAAAQGDTGPPGRDGRDGSVGPTGSAGVFGGKIPITDGRGSTSDTPQDYWKRGMGVYSEFKQVNVGGPFQRVLLGALTTTVPWSDPSGGAIRQEFVVGSEKWTRASTGPTGWQTGPQHTWNVWQDDSPTPESLLNSVNDLKNRAITKDMTFRIQDGNSQFISLKGDGGPDTWEILRFAPVDATTDRSWERAGRVPLRNWI